MTEEQLADCHPAYAAYVYAQNQVSVMSEQLTGLKEMAPFAPSSPKLRTSICQVRRQ